MTIAVTPLPAKPEHTTVSVLLTFEPEAVNLVRDEMRQALENKTLNRCPNLKNLMSLFLAATAKEIPS